MLDCQLPGAVGVALFGPMQKRFSWRCVFVIMLAAFSVLAGGCSSVGAQVQHEMTRRNEADLKAGKSTPRDYRERRDEIDRNLK
jgi:hypothetical protein